MGKWEKGFPDQDFMCIQGVLAVRVHQAEVESTTPGRKQRAILWHRTGDCRSLRVHYFDQGLKAAGCGGHTVDFNLAAMGRVDLRGNAGIWTQLDTDREGKKTRTCSE